MMKWWIAFVLIALKAYCVIPEKILICGVAKNVEESIQNVIDSSESLGSQFEDYRVLIYENNSTDKTKTLFAQWAKENEHVLFLSEDASHRRLVKESPTKKKSRTELIARARNFVLNIALSKEFDDYKYIVWADLDFSVPWDVPTLLETISSPQEEWDAVFAYGAYDLFALKSEEWPIGFELLGDTYWSMLAELRREFILEKDAPWKKVYSAFGGLAIYKRDALRGCSYSGVVTPELEKLTALWLAHARIRKDVLFLQEYEALLSSEKIIRLKDKIIHTRTDYPEILGVRISNDLFKGNVVWFSCTRDMPFPLVCEHIPLHASMILKGRDKLFINPKLGSSHP